MSEAKKKGVPTNFGYQPRKVVKDGYQPTESGLSQPPNKGSNVQPPKKSK